MTLLFPVRTLVEDGWPICVLLAEFEYPDAEGCCTPQAARPDQSSHSTQQLPMPNRSPRTSRAADRASDSRGVFRLRGKRLGSAKKKRRV